MPSADAQPAGRRTLDRVRRGRTVRVVGVEGTRTLVRRMAALGIVRGATVTVTRPRGPALLWVNRANVAVGEKAARAVLVEDVG